MTRPAKTSPAFGAALSRQRRARGWRQQDLGHHLHGAFARSTIANIEAGREAPSARFWQCLQDRVPELAAALQDDYASWLLASASISAEGGLAHQGRLGGPFVIERMTLVYIFRDSPAPEEILEFRRLRATRPDPGTYGFRLTKTDSPAFQTQTEVLWGGTMHTEPIQTVDRVLYWRYLDFGTPLEQGQHHEFALRTWIDRDPDPSTCIKVDLTIPAERIEIRLNFYGPNQPSQIWTLGPTKDNTDPTDPDPSTSLQLDANGSAGAGFLNPILHHNYGIAWSWPS